jgi:hypothetical protein
MEHASYNEQIHFPHESLIHRIQYLQIYGSGSDRLQGRNRTLVVESEMKGGTFAQDT